MRTPRGQTRWAAETADRWDATSPRWENQRLLAKGYVGQAAIPPEKR
jgi:hypothetical protein